MMTQHKGPQSATLSLRLSREERAWLEREAGASSLGAFIKGQLFAAAPPKAGRRPLPVRNQRTIAHALARLGRDELAASLRDLACAARSGSLICDTEVRDALLAGCAAIESIRSMLVTALGLKANAVPQHTLSTPRRAKAASAFRETAR